MTNLKLCISTSSRSATNKLGIVIIHSVSCDVINTLYLHFHKSCKHQTRHCGEFGLVVPIYQATCHMPSRHIT